MTLEQQLTADMLLAMKAKNELKLSVIRMAKTLITNKEKDKKDKLTDQEVSSILQTMIKQRKDSAEQFTNGGRIYMADKELEEITIIETYLPKEASREDIVLVIDCYLSSHPEEKNLGTLIKAAKGHLEKNNLRVDGRLLSEVVKEKLNGN